MKFSLLDMVQDILSDMDAEEVNSINDNVEAMQVARIVRRCYYDIVSPNDMPEHFDLFSLTPSGDPDKPTLMSLPDEVNRVDWIQYNIRLDGDTADQFRPVSPVSVAEFFRRMNYLSTDSDNVGQMTVTVQDPMTFQFVNNRAPQIYCIYDDNTVIFDAYDAAVDNTLQSSKTQAYGLLSVPFTLSDNFVPDLDDRHFPLLLNESLSTSFAVLKQAQNAPAQMKARNQKIDLQRTKFKQKRNYYAELPNYGRK